MLYLYLFEYAKLNGGIHFICFSLGMSFLGNLGSKSENCLLKVKFGTYPNSNMLDSIVLFI